MKVSREGSEQLGASIRQRRHETGKTMSQVARETGISQPYLSQIERGEVTNPTVETVFRILEALDQDLLLRGSRRPTPQITSVYLSPFTLEELTKTGEEYSGQSVVRQVQEILKDPQLPIQQRRLLGKQIASLVKVVKEEVQSQESMKE